MIITDKAGLRKQKRLGLEDMFDVTHIVQNGGLLLIAAIIFAESGMFVGFFFPGDTLLMTAGIFAAQGHLNLFVVIAVIALAAIIGDNTGFHIGKKYGRSLFKKEDGIFFRRAYVQRAEQFFEKYGTKSMLFSHFVPVVRTFTPPVAGAAHMNHKQFFVFDAIGCILWATSVTLVGYWFGQKIPNVDKYIEFAVIGVVVIVLGPSIYHVVKALLEDRRRQKPPKTPDQ